MTPESELVERLRPYAQSVEFQEREMGAWSLMVEAAHVLTAHADEIARLRGALIEAGREAGAGLSDDVSTDFLMYVPGEVRGRILKLEAALADRGGDR